MSFLTPLYIAGLLAVSLPIVFHLIRRSPRGEVPFSSVMFLSPSPPRITRRSRLDQLLLLLLRGLVLAILAFAFARPFLRQAARLNREDVGQQRVAIVIDTSASMRRGDLWQQAIATAEEVLSETQPQDQIGVYVADSTLRPVASFEDLSQVEPGSRNGMIMSRLQSYSPTWSGTNLGQGILDAVEAASNVRDTTEEAGRAPRRVVLISDMQEGSRLSVLGEYTWPPDAELELKQLQPSELTNAGLHRLSDDPELASADEAAGGRAVRVRVTNAAESNVDSFVLQWAGTGGAAALQRTDVYVPAGESRVARVPVPMGEAARPRLELVGDAHDFDNALYMIPRSNEQYKIAYLGTDAPDDEEGLRYFFQHAVEADVTRSVEIETLPAGEDFLLDEPAFLSLVVVTTPPSEEQAERLADYVSAGGTVLYVVTEGDDGAGLAALRGVDAMPVEEADIDDYTMLGEIAFDHPLFAPMAGPQYNDFTQIRFWRFRRLGDYGSQSSASSAVSADIEQESTGEASLAGRNPVRVLARFEGGHPAIVEERIGQGRLMVMASGWHPRDSQLFRFWKFVLMVSSLVDGNRATRGLQTEYIVGQRVMLPETLILADDPAVTKPDGSEVLLATGAESFDGTDQPGLYALATADGAAHFVVNLDPEESETTAVPAETFEQLGCLLAGRSDNTQLAKMLEQMRDVELESRQKIWQWLVAAALCVLILETWLAGRASRAMETPAAAV